MAAIDVQPIPLPLWEVTLERVIARDGGICVWCGRQPWREDLTAEHLLPRARQGHGVADNLAVACRACNKRRRTRSIAAYLRAQLEVGETPRVDLLRHALERLSRSASRRHADYGRRELQLLQRLSQRGRRDQR
ncbi:MAG: HNH endonuclease [Solirubrobacterales bacterium]|nr:HNH endonuclease [Solirubrobacterales bacterium]